MDHHRKEIADRVRKGRLAKNLTQLELAAAAGLGLRSVQRIEAGEVEARAYTLRALGKVLEIELSVHVENPYNGSSYRLTKGGVGLGGTSFRASVIAILLGSCIFLFASAFLMQSPGFPETDFEMVIYWAVVLCGYLILLAKLWYGSRRSFWRL